MGPVCSLRASAQQKDHILTSMRGKVLGQLCGIVAELEACSSKLTLSNDLRTALGKAGKNGVSQRAFSSFASNGAGNRISNVAAALRAYKGSGTSSEFSSVASRLLGRDARSVEMALWRRMYSNEAPRKGWDKFYPKNKGRRPAANAKTARGKPPQTSNFTVVHFKLSRSYFLIMPLF